MSAPEMNSHRSVAGLDRAQDVIGVVRIKKTAPECPMNGIECLFGIEDETQAHFWLQICVGKRGGGVKGGLTSQLRRRVF